MATILQMTFLNQFSLISYSKFSEVFRKGLIDSMSPLVQEMAWHLLGAKPLPEPMLNQIHDHMASLDHNEFIHLI